MSKEKFTFESLQDTETIRDFLAALIEGFEKGRIVLESDDDEIVLTPKGLLSFTVKARKKEDRYKLSVKVSWKESFEDQARETKSLTISN